MNRFSWYLRIICLSILVQSLFGQGPKAPQCNTAADFDCNFESECECWRQGQNGVEDDIDWAVGNQVATFGWASIPRARTDINSTFAYAIRDANHLVAVVPKGAMLISKSIPCLDKAVTLKLWYWKAAFLPQIRVCYKYFNEPNLAKCSAEVNGFQPPDWLPLTANLPPINRPFQIVIQAIRLFPLQSAVAIDDITIEGDLTCSNDNKGKPTASGRPVIVTGATTPPNPRAVTPAAPGEGADVAKVSSCSGVQLAESWSGDFNRGVWEPCENGTSCKQPTGAGAATVWAVEGEGTFVLESQDFKLVSDSVLSFQYEFMQKNFTSKLRLCIDALDACPFAIRGSSQKDKWTQESFPLTAGWHKIFFTVTNLKKSDFVKVRRINVHAKENNQGSKSSACALLMTLIEE